MRRYGPWIAIVTVSELPPMLITNGTWSPAATVAGMVTFGLIFACDPGRESRERNGGGKATDGDCGNPRSHIKWTAIGRSDLSNGKTRSGWAAAGNAAGSASQTLPAI
jgi:hypothetical protein